MFDKYLDFYILKMDSIKLIENTIEENIPNKINKEVERYKDAILMDLYFDQLLSGEPDKEIEEYVKKYIVINEFNPEEKKINYKFIRKGDKLNKYKNIEESRKAVSKGFFTMRTMYNNLLVSILIEFENIVTGLFKELITKIPDAYLKNTSISYAEIIKSQDIAEIKNTIISNEVDSIMRENIFTWIKELENKHGIEISLENEYTRNFIEAYFRRNIIVHNDSKINHDYINGMKKIKRTISEESIGKKVLCTKKYIDKVIESSIYFVIYIMNQMLKVFKEENENFTNAILNMGFEKIKSEEYSLAREIFRLLKDNKTLDQQTKIYSLINFWQTYKWNNKYEEVEKEINDFDISAYEELIKLAIYALRDEYDSIEQILNNEFNDEKQNEDLAIELEDFPIFKEVRKQQFYINLKEKYTDVFAIKSALIDEESEGERKEIVKNSKGKFQVTMSIKNEE